jgi:hypothetical protein
MKLLKFKLLFLSFFLFIKSFSQDFYDIKLPEGEFSKKCIECYELIKSKPREIQYGIQRDDQDNLYFVVTKKEWFDLLMKKSGDGIAIDIISRERYDCSNTKLSKNKYIRGDLQKPIYLKELKNNMLPSEHGEVIIKVGAVPEQYKNKEVEFNFIFLKDKNYCHYNSFYDLKSYRWDLLDMGLYFDTLTYKTSFDTSLNDQEKYILQHKIMKFEIPFERNKADYLVDDIKPLYDSLKITDFNIKKISIRAYSSIEGNEERNIQLQQERAQSIIKALQSFQQPTITNEVQASENWVDFLNDISLTSYAYFSDLSKEEIKEKLKDKKLVEELEPYLQKHRKAVIILDLQKKNKYENIAVNELIGMFTKSISDKNLEQAIEIQNSIFEKVRNHELPVNYVDKLEVPEKSDYSLLLNKNSIFKYLMDESDVYNTFKELNELQDYIPNDGHIKYNICALKFKIWLLGSEIINPIEFKKEINDLKKWGIPQNLIKRMLINYEVIMCEYYMMQGDFVNKDKSLKFIYSNYKSVPLTDFDYLSLAQYFSSYAKYDWAIKLLEKKVHSIDVDEDLLFYYINLTIVNEKLTKKSDYRTIMLNAYNINKKRYCELFNTYGKGGVTFQLLENEYLRKTYCESCK